MIFLWLLLWLPVNTKTRKSLYFQRFRAGDERIELPPKVLETPIIPFDQSPTKYILYTLKTTYMLTFPWDSLLPALLSEWSTPRGHFATTSLQKIIHRIIFCTLMCQCHLLRKCPVCTMNVPSQASLLRLIPVTSCPLSQRFGQALTRLVTVSSMHYCTSTSALSTSSSSRGFTS